MLLLWTLWANVEGKRSRKETGLIQPTEDLSIWIDEDQVKIFSGITHLIIHVVANGIVMPYLLDRNLETHLPIVPPEVRDRDIT